MDKVFTVTDLALPHPLHLLPNPLHLLPLCLFLRRLTMSRIQLVSMLEGSQEALRVCREALHAHQQANGDLPKIVIGSSSEEESLASSDRLSSPHTGSFSSECCAWLWCKTAEIFLMCGQLKDAANSLKEAQQITPNSIQVLLLVSESTAPPTLYLPCVVGQTCTRHGLCIGVPPPPPPPSSERPFV